MRELTSCKAANEACISQRYFALAHLYKEEKIMNMHVHDFCEIYYSISGGKQFLIDNKLYCINPGDIFVINQYESHYLTQIDETIHERIVLPIHPEFLKQISSLDTDLSYCFTKREHNFSHKLSLTVDQQKRFLYYVNKITSSNGYGHDLMERTSFIELLLLLNSAYFEVCKNKTQESSLTYNKQVDDFLAYINKNIDHPITLEELSSNFYLSESYICRIFKSATGMTINKYITARRISIAKSLLANGLSVKEACIKSGYNDYSNFVKSFTKIVGISPKKYAQCSNIMI
ncbi:MAG: AraC family transcriptional regulator [Velocimicrobium sp.]